MLIPFVALLLAQAPPPTAAEVVEKAPASDWRALDPENTLYLELAAGRVIVELAPEMAPRHVASIKALAREGFFDGLSIYRVQENYVAQGGDADEKRQAGRAKLKAEFALEKSAGVEFTRLADEDGYAPETGWVRGFAAARTSPGGPAWLVHCPGAFAMPRDEDPDSGTTDFYVVIGHAPRHLDRNTTVFGRVVQGIERLSTLPRGTGRLGFYEKPEERHPIRRARVAADLPEAERVALQLMRTDSASFAALVEARRNRREAWFHAQAGHVEVCNVPVPIREKR
jgi:peptidylprolyl isomerase